MAMLAVLVLVAASASAAPPAGWAHVGNTVNSAIFVDRAVLAENGPRRHFRTLHVNTQPSAGWRLAEHRGTIDCAAQTLTYAGVTMTETNGQRQVLPSAMTAPVPFPAKGVMRTLATSICDRTLGHAVGDPQDWTKKHFRPE